MIRNLVVFPGILFHELSHYIMCVVLRVRVTKFKVSPMSESGFIEHKVPSSIIKSMLIAIAPFIFALITAYMLIRNYSNNLILEAITLYFSYILLYTSFPSKEDTNFNRFHPLFKKILTFPFFIILRIQYWLASYELIKVCYSVAVILLFFNVL